MKIKSYYITLFLFLFLFSHGSKITKAYKALSIYNYFEAKHLFEKTIRKKPSAASYGLATIYARTDNPFSQIDSAAKYIVRAKQLFKDTISYSGYHINPQTIQLLSNQIALRGFKTYCHKNEIGYYNYYLKTFFFANDSLIQTCTQLRDSIAFTDAQFYESSDSVRDFLMSYPQSIYNVKALALFNQLQYREQVPNSNLQQLKYFIKKYPLNTYVLDAEKKVYEQTQQLHNADSTYRFIKNYSTAQTTEQAWKSLYSLVVKNYSSEELSLFLKKYPDYPYNENVVKEISLSQQLLLPITLNNGKAGYIDTLGNWKIMPQYDDANFFEEGYAAVCKNDSCFYINKEGNKVSDLIFEEVENDHQAVAIVKKNNLFYLVNRSAQFISKGYEDINQSSDNLFVCKSSGFYGAINAKGETIIPLIYNKLGDFKNGYAYFLSNKYGLINTKKNTLNADWDWISDVDTNNIVVVKSNNQFGLMQTNGAIILQPQFDYIEPCANYIYLVVKNGKYGFYNYNERCYATAIDYDYNKAYKADDYTTGKNFKLLKNNEVALIDANGRFSINFGTYTNLFFAKCDVIRIQKNNKYGFVDRKLKAITPIDFDKATDFENETAIVSKGNKTMLINKEGKLIYQIKDGTIEKTNGMNYKVTQNNLQGLVNVNGDTQLLQEFEEIKQLKAHFYVCIKPDGFIYLWNELTKKIIKL